MAGWAVRCRSPFAVVPGLRIGYIGAMALLPPSFLDAVVAIGVPGTTGTSWVGTGFLYGVPVGKDGAYELFLVSNKHVFRGKQECVLRFNSRVDDAASIDFAAPLIARNGREKWVGHPDEAVDVGAISIKTDVLEKNDRRYVFFAADTMTARRADLSAMGVTEGDGAFVLGFPMGIVGADDRQYVICRSGSIARIQNTLSGANEFLIDAMVFPGNSGGPVILRPELTAIEGTSEQREARLIGIVKSYLAYEDIAYSQQTNRERIRFQENSGLASVVAVDLIDETVALADKRRRERSAAQRARGKKTPKKTAKKR
jgi:hypothetical protein